MSQQVSVEAALPVFRQRCNELHDESLILRARVTELEQQLADAHQEIEQLRAQPTMGQTPQPLSCIDPDPVA
jgi:phage shock protein A